MAIFSSESDEFVEYLLQHPSQPRILCEGDSWFALPFRINLIDQIDSMAELAILNLASNGHEILQIMSGSQKQKLRQCLKEKEYAFHLLLFSGGGNDIVGENLLPLLKRKTSNMSWQDCIHEERLARRVEQLRLAYKDLIDIRDDCRPECTILTHGYDYPIATGIGFLMFGPWIKPYMEQMNIKNPEDQFNITKSMIERFNTELSKIATTTNNFIHASTPNTLTAEEWGDELHPTSVGFKKVANKLKPKLKLLLPDAGIK